MDWQFKIIVSFFLWMAVQMFWVPAQFVVGLNTFRLLKIRNTNSAFKWVTLYTTLAILYMIFEIIMSDNYKAQLLTSNIIIPILTITFQIFIYKYFSRRFLP